MEKVKQHYKLGKLTWREGRFVGEQVTLLSDGSITLDQQFYTEARVAPIQISRDRKRKRFSACSPEEIEQLRALVGMLSWLSKETRCDLAGKNRPDSTVISSTCECPFESAGESKKKRHGSTTDCRYPSSLQMKFTICLNQA